MNYSTHVRQSRKALDWSAVKLADRAGVHRSVVTRIENGHNVHTHLLHAVLQALGLQIQLTTQTNQVHR